MWCTKMFVPSHMHPFYTRVSNNMFTHTLIKKCGQVMCLSAGARSSHKPSQYSSQCLSILLVCCSFVAFIMALKHHVPTQPSFTSLGMRFVKNLLILMISILVIPIHLYDFGSLAILLMINLVLLRMLKTDVENTALMVKCKNC